VPTEQDKSKEQKAAESEVDTFDVDQCVKSIFVKINSLKGATSTQGVQVFNSTFPLGPF
jgi:hypothetical protein